MTITSAGRDACGIASTFLLTNYCENFSNKSIRNITYKKSLFLQTSLDRLVMSFDFTGKKEWPWYSPCSWRLSIAFLTIFICLAVGVCRGIRIYLHNWLKVGIAWSILFLTIFFQITFFCFANRVKAFFFNPSKRWRDEGVQEPLACFLFLEFNVESALLTNFVF